MTPAARHFRRLFFGALALFVSCMLSVTGYTLWRLQGETLRNGLDKAASYTRNTEDFLTQSLRVTELATAQALPSSTEALDLAGMARGFVTTLEHAPFLRSISLLDAQGHIITSSNPANVGVIVATHNYLPASDGRQTLLRIGAPWTGRDFATGQTTSATTPAPSDAITFVPITYTLVQETRAVTVVVALNPDYFLNHISQMLDATEGSVEVLRFDGTQLMATNPESQVGALQGDVVRALGLPRIESGTFEQVLIGQHEVLTAFRASRLYPFVVLTHLDRDYAFQAWHREATTLLGVVGSVLLLTSLISVLYYRRQLIHAAQRSEAASAQRISATVFDASAEAITITDVQGHILSVNPAFTHMSGYSAADAVGRNPRLLNSGLQSKAFYEQLWSDLLLHGSWHGEMVNRHKDGHLVDVQMSITTSRDSLGEAQHFIGVSTDITERKKSEKDVLQLNTQLNQFKNTLDQTLEAVFICDPESLRFTYVNQGAMQQVGYSETELMQMTPVDIKPLYSLAQFQKVVQPLIDGVRPSFTFQTVHRHKDGHDVPVEVFLQLIRLEGQAPRFVAMVTDISERHAAQKQIEFLAYHDPLTGLPNRLLAKDHLEQAVLVAERENSRVALLFIDLDKFKTINDSLGHVIGDGLLKGVTIRLRECLRDIDTLSRQGGDEFLIVLNNMRDTEPVTMVAEKILGRMAEPFEIDHHELSVSLSIGIAVYPDDGKDFDTLLKHSDTAMYQAKDAGRNTHRFHTAQMNIDAIEHLRMRNGLRRALEQGEFVLHYQPQISLATGAVFGAEALIRWHHPELGMVPPGRFISVAEDSGLIVPIGEWVLREACRQSVAWRKAGLPELLIAVNLSAVQFKRGDVLKSVIQALAESGLEPALLELELTESILIKDTEKVLTTVRQLKSLGIKLSIDDFGTGYSSLSYLKRFDVDKLKIDQSFVRDMADDPDDAAIVRAIIQMAKSLNLTTVAEGVEDERQLALLRLQHCDEAQGFHFARPMPADEFASFIFKGTSIKQGNP